MAKKQTFGDKAKKGAKAVEQDHNFFGTRQDMVVKEIKEGEEVIKLIAKDEKGLYVTYPSYIGSGIADPNRFGSDRTKPTGYEKELAETK